MVRTLRFLGVCLALLLVAARVEAASVTLAWDANSETDLSGYYVGYRTSPTGSETLVNVGNVTTWTLTTASAGNTYYFRVYAENTSGLRSAPSTEVSTTIPNDAATAERRRADARARRAELRRGQYERHRRSAPRRRHSA